MTPPPSSEVEAKRKETQHQAADAKETVATGAGGQEGEEEKETFSNFLSSLLSLGSTAGTCSCVSAASVLETFWQNSTQLPREGPCFLPGIWQSPAR